MNDAIRVYFDRVPGYDKHALFILRRTFSGGHEALTADGEWAAYDAPEAIAPTLVIDGHDWRDAKAPLLKALGGLPEASADTEVRVLREWLASEQARVERAFDR